MLLGRSEDTDLIFQNHISQNVRYLMGRATGPAIGESDNTTVYMLWNFSQSSPTINRGRKDCKRKKWLKFMESKDHRVLASEHLVCGGPEVPTRYTGMPGELSDYNPGAPWPVTLSLTSLHMWWPADTWSPRCGEVKQGILFYSTE